MKDLSPKDQEKIYKILDRCFGLLGAQYVTEETLAEVRRLQGEVGNIEERSRRVWEKRSYTAQCRASSNPTINREERLSPVEG